MTPERWQEVEDVLQRALDRPPHERASFIEEACAGDAELRDEASSLIDAYEQADDFIEQPAIAEDASILLGGNFNNIGRVLGPYRIVEHLGSGGMGEVYLAEDNRLNRFVALKILPTYFLSDDMRLRRFQREAQAASALNHPNILTIHEVGESEGLRFIATEFIEGHTIRELITQQELRIEDILDIAAQIASALSAAHAAGIVHRDIKPENIMRRMDGLVKILDFGIAKLLEPTKAENAAGITPAQSTRAQTEAGLVMGTVSYMSPEQARGLPVDERTDIWSLGVVLYEMLARRLPFAGATRIDTIVSILEHEPRPLNDVTNEHKTFELLQPLINKALRKERTERYQTTTELLADLDSAGRQLQLASSSSLTIPATRTVKYFQRRYVVSALVVAVLLLTVIAGRFLFLLSKTPQTYIRATAEATAGQTKLYTQMSEAEQISFIDEQEQRISAMMGDRPLKLNENALRSIKYHVDRYVALSRSGLEESDEESLNSVYSRALPYVPLIARSFSERKVPIIIGIYLPLIESAYRNCYENSFGAKGLFQFMPQTAMQYGVAQEDMCDVEKMTPAAAHYIADRMAELGEDSQSLTLVLLSYNRGPEWVRNTLRRLRGLEGYERNFWTLFAHRDSLDQIFRDENAAYVPSFFAAAIIGENPETFELTTPALSTLAGSEQK
jgi:protein kinase-like protein/transglycosylase-like protein with SLT domain